MLFEKIHNYNMEELIDENIRLRAELDRYQKRQYHATFSEAFKENVRTFFGRKCVMCGKPEHKLARKLSVHHVEYDVQRDCYETPFVPLCDDCHTLPHAKLSERPYWIRFFCDIIKSQYGGKWCYSKEEFAIIRNLDPKIRHCIETCPAFNKGKRVSDKALIRFISSRFVCKSKPKPNHIASKIKKNITYMIFSGILSTETDNGKKFIRKIQHNSKGEPV
jgi:hypothetical protein